MVPNHALPLRHLDRMHLVFPCNLSNRFDTHQGFQSHLRLEGTCIPLPFDLAHSSAVFSCPAEPEKSNLATGPNFGVHYWVTGLRSRRLFRLKTASLISSPGNLSQMGGRVRLYFLGSALAGRIGLRS